MIRPVRASGALLAALLLAVAAGCGQATPTSTPAASSAAPTATAPASAAATPSPSAAVSSSASVPVSASPSGAASGASPSPTATDDPAYHADPALEALIPSELMNVELTKISLPLTFYLHDSDAGDAKLYTEWLHQLGLSVEDASIAIAHDFSETQNLTIVAIRPKGADSTRLTGAVKAAAQKLDWPTVNVVVAQKDVLEVVDPTGDVDAGRATAAVYSKDGVTYFVITDDPAVRLEVFIRLP